MRRCSRPPSLIALLINRSPTAPAASRRASSPYSPARPFEDLHILDALELSGSQKNAAAFLAMHQSTVSRSLQLVRQEFELKPVGGHSVCRHGQNETLEQLRLAYRTHRLMKGVLRLSTDGLHQPLLGSHPQLQMVPARFRSHGDWAELVRLGLLDGAIISSYGLEKSRPPGALPRWSRIQVEPLGTLPLQLMAASPAAKGVLLPRLTLAPMLHQAIRRHGYKVEVQSAASPEPEAWIKRLRDRQLAVPVNPSLVGPTWLQQQGLQPLAEQPGLAEQLWLMLPVGPLPGSATAQRWIRRLRRLVMAAGGDTTLEAECLQA